jgi:hypothetical protein
MGQQLGKHVAAPRRFRTSSRPDAAFPHKRIGCVAEGYGPCSPSAQVVARQSGTPRQCIFLANGIGSLQNCEGYIWPHNKWRIQKSGRTTQPRSQQVGIGSKTSNRFVFSMSLDLRMKVGLKKRDWHFRDAINNQFAPLTHVLRHFSSKYLGARTPTGVFETSDI